VILIFVGILVSISVRTFRTDSPDTSALVSRVATAPRLSLAPVYFMNTNVHGDDKWD
jgi:hypothetical protein